MLVGITFISHGTLKDHRFREFRAFFAKAQDRWFRVR